VEVCIDVGEVEEFERSRLGVGGGVVVEVELALVLWVFEDALAGC
jgi:hypothetical protein